MNRRIFAKSVMGTMGISLIVAPSLAAIKSKQHVFEAGHQMTSDEGLKMSLSGHSLPTANKDHKQFVLTFDVENPNGYLDEKIYHLIDHNGKKHQIFMSPVDKNKLQAVYNWRTNA
ncbi:hypothetical protein [Marinicella litoralis]|uniref:Uncharacterized protein n=1 Tax=Marinicella litoralis TaxID=644220 RepID=A0A4R6XRB1_9GAMM|nr:hypothetical protein [Marinicella litoralis]TDR22425.1 hypothetical protein C8D91_0914 [Marinicella litoralis]